MKGWVIATAVALMFLVGGAAALPRTLLSDGSADTLGRPERALESGGLEALSKRAGRGTDVPGTGFGLEASAGIQGILSFFQLGVVFPRIKGSLFLALSARMASSLTWATFYNMDTMETVSFHPVLAAGVLSFGGSSPLLYGVVRMYGGTDLLLGYTFTPYDSAIYGIGNLVGDNLTFAILGYFGLEFFTSPRLAVFLDAGGGFKSLFGDENNPYAVASSWLGSGFGFRLGVRFYPARP
jgi:hypothetical protein